VVNGCVGIQHVVFAGLELTDLKQAKALFDFGRRDAPHG
jgi:hypothetical protein